MRHLKFSKKALRNIDDIYDYLARKSQSIEVADRFTSQIWQKCHDIAELPFLIGKARPDLHPDLHSVVFKGYVIFFRPSETTIEIVTILEGHRDFTSYFDNNRS